MNEPVRGEQNEYGPARRLLSFAHFAGGKRREAGNPQKCDASGATLTECSRERQMAATCQGNFVGMFRNHYRLGECRDCGAESVLRRRVPRHEVHLALTIVTLGFWGMCWIITIIAARWEPWRCRRCRQPQEEQSPGEGASDPASTVTAVGSAFGLIHKHLE
jgi:hypothetical protein